MIQGARQTQWRREPMALYSERVERRVKRAARFVGDYWLPVNEELVESIRDSLEQDPPIDQIVQAVQKDFSLFLFCIRRLKETLKEEGVTFERSRNPVEMMYAAGLDRLKNILENDTSKISGHKLGGADDLQMARFHETLVSSSSADVLAKHYGVDRDTAYSAAVLRQLGLTLVAWNHQGVYTEVAGSLKEGESLDLKLAERLGYSPNLLAIRVLGSWGISEQQCASLGLYSGFDPEQELRDAMNDSLVELCEVGEALARAQHPELYPSAEKDWETAEREISERLGPNGMRIIRGRIVEAQDAYASFMPHVFHAGLLEAYVPEEPPRTEEDRENPFLSHCSPATARAIRELCGEIKSGSTASKNVRKFGHETICASGFTGGAVYAADPGIMMLMPKFTFGEVRLGTPKPIDYSIVLSDGHMVALAYQGVEPVVQYKRDEYGRVYTAIAGMFGRSQRVGVLYLEIPGAVSDFLNDEHVIHYQALRHVLNDCLRLT